MASVITRTGKGSEINQAENDDNLESLCGINKSQTGAYEIVAADQNGTIECSNASTTTITLDLISDILSAIDTSDFGITIKNIGVGDLTITPTTDTFDDGGITKTLRQYESISLQTDSTQALWNITGSSYSKATLSYLPVLLASQTASGDSSIDFTTEITSLYRRYRIDIYDLAPATVSNELMARVSAGSGFIATTTYQSNGGIRDHMQLTINPASFGSIILAKGVFEFNTYSASPDSRFKAKSDLRYNNGSAGGTNTQGLDANHDEQTTSSTDGIQFYFGTGNITSGVFNLFGVPD